MNKIAERIILITGASSGIGKACTSCLLDDGHRVYGTYRSSMPPTKSNLHHKQGKTNFPVLIHMNVNDELSVKQGIQFILEKELRIDVVINSAGYALAGALEDTTVEEAKQLFETNLWGIHRVCRAVLPAMREQRSGIIINISSIAGQVPLPFQGFYCASKFALEGMTEALRMEVCEFGIHVVLVEPGDLATAFTAHRHLARSREGDSPYSEKFTRALDVIEYEEMHGYSPESVARKIEKIIQHPSPKLRYKIASPLQKSSVILKKILPGRLFEWIIMKFYKVT
jgi:NAD(P)-dependent dehydrogenase (short-subunit alcohol dehydrogenase family)